MSFSSTPRRTGSARKSSSAKKKVAKRKQDFHTSKKRVRTAEKPDIDALKERTISGLEHLGHQKFSVDKGSYGMEGWVKSLGLLLDDFESKVDAGQLPSEYPSERERLMKNLSTPVDTSDLDAKASAIRSEEVALKTKLEKEEERILARLSEIRTQSERQTKELEDEKSKLVQLTAERKKASFFSKLVGRGGPATKPVETKIEDLRGAMKKLEEEETQLNNSRTALDRRGTDSPDPYAADWRRLNEISGEITNLDSQLQVKMLREGERLEATEILAKLLADVKAPPAETG